MSKKSSVKIVLASGDNYRNLHISKICKQHNIKCVYNIEYILETRYQIIDLDDIPLIIKLRRKIFAFNTERRRIQAFKLADGIQANGFAAFEAYKNLTNSLVYLDNRINKNLLVNKKELTTRLSALQKNKTLRLAFSGRLIRMKGADDLIKLARLLKERKIQFILTIFGDGELKNDLQRDINKYKIDDYVELKGSVDFYKELIPYVKNNVDLYVMLHKQSDPSCTYLETLSCGVPIVGYKNKAFAGLLKQADIGWGVELGDIKGIQDIIVYLYSNRELITKKSLNSLEFSSQHDFETTFQNRINHLIYLSENI